MALQTSSSRIDFSNFYTSKYIRTILPILTNAACSFAIYESISSIHEIFITNYFHLSKNLLTEQNIYFGIILLFVISIIPFVFYEDEYTTISLENKSFLFFWKRQVYERKKVKQLMLLGVIPLSELKVLEKETKVDQPPITDITKDLIQIFLICIPYVGSSYRYIKGSTSRLTRV